MPLSIVLVHCVRYLPITIPQLTLLGNTNLTGQTRVRIRKKADLACGLDRLQTIDRIKQNIALLLSACVRAGTFFFALPL